jgi:hypothetical protein
MWAAYLHVHVSKATQPGTLPAVLIRQFSTVNLENVASTAVDHMTELLRLRGHLLAMEGRSVEPLVDDVVSSTMEIVTGYLSPVESRAPLKRLLSPFPPANRVQLRELDRKRAQTCQELEMLALSHCSTLKGRELARGPRSQRLQELSLVKDGSSDPNRARREGKQATALGAG